MKAARLAKSLICCRAACSLLQVAYVGDMIMYFVASLLPFPLPWFEDGPSEVSASGEDKSVTLR